MRLTWNLWGLDPVMRPVVSDYYHLTASILREFSREPLTVSNLHHNDNAGQHGSDGEGPVALVPTIKV